MGVSTNGQLSYGVVVKEDYELPWENTLHRGDIDDWWLDARGFKPSVYPFDSDGNYAVGYGDKSPAVTQYFAEKRVWQAENPIPVVLVNYCSGDYPMYIIAAASKDFTAWRGEPEMVSLAEIRETDEAHAMLMCFLDEFGIQYEDEPMWLLSSYWG